MIQELELVLEWYKGYDSGIELELEWYKVMIQE